VVDERGRLYTVGGTSGINYFMDVFSLDLTRFVENSAADPGSCIFLTPRSEIWGVKNQDPDPGLTTRTISSESLETIFWAKNT
jgi:hypothetical protein